MSDNNNPKENIPIAVDEPTPDAAVDEPIPDTNIENESINIDETPEIKEAYKNLYSDLEKSFYNSIILKMNNPNEYKKWPPAKRDPDELGKQLQHDLEDFSNNLCYKEEIDVIFTHDFMEIYVTEIANQIFKDEYINYIIELYIKKINKNLYKSKSKYRLLYFNITNSSSKLLQLLNHKEKDGKKYGSIFNIPTKDISIPEQNYNE